MSFVNVIVLVECLSRIESKHHSRSFTNYGLLDFRQAIIVLTLSIIFLNTARITKLNEKLSLENVNTSLGRLQISTQSIEQRITATTTTTTTTITTTITAGNVYPAGSKWHFIEKQL